MNYLKVAHFLFVYQSSCHFIEQFISGVQVIQCPTHQTVDSSRLTTAQGKLPVDFVYEGIEFNRRTVLRLLLFFGHDIFSLFGLV